MPRRAEVIIVEPGFLTPRMVMQVWVASRITPAPWGSSFSKAQWQLTPAEFEALCRQAKEVLESRPADALAGRLVLLDNWNEFGEGHYILPTRQYGFGYLDAVRAVFAPGAPPHRDFTPDVLGLGPYDAQHRAFTAEHGP